MVESNSNEILRDSDITDVAFLVVGDPFASVSYCFIHLFILVDIMTILAVQSDHSYRSVNASGL